MGSISSVFSTDNVTINVGSAVPEKENLTFERSDLLNLVDGCIVYPKDSSVLEKEVKEAEKDGVVLDYHCTSGKCNFDPAMLKLASGPESAEVKAFGVLEVTSELVRIIAENPKCFPASGVHGYVFQSVGRPYLYLRNATKGGPNVNRVGFLDLTDVKKKLYYKQLKDQEEKKRDQDVISGAAVGMLALLLAQRLMRTVK